MRLDATTALPDGSRVRVRLPQAADRERLAALHVQLGIALDELDLARELRFDPRRRTVICAVVWDAGVERLAGWAAADRDATAPDLLLADEATVPGVTQVLRDAIAAAASAAA